MATATAPIVRFRLVFNVPLHALEACKTAIFAAGAGRYPKYTECCWTIIGAGQFRPGDKASPHIGKPGELETVQEARVETLIMGEDVARKVVQALKSYAISPSVLTALQHLCLAG